MVQFKVSVFVHHFLVVHYLNIFRYNLKFSRPQKYLYKMFMLVIKQKFHISSRNDSLVVTVKRRSEHICLSVSVLAFYMLQNQLHLWVSLIVRWNIATYQTAVWVKDDRCRADHIRITNEGPQLTYCSWRSNGLLQCPYFETHNEIQQHLIKSFTLFNWLLPWNRVLLEKLIITHLLKKFPAFYGTRKFITVFTRFRTIPIPCAAFHNKLFFMKA